MKLLVFSASHRKESVNRKLAKCAAEIAQKAGAEIDFTEYNAFDMPIYDDEAYCEDRILPKAAESFVGRLNSVDAVMLASPEYNWSFPGSLKNIIDWASVVTQNPFSKKSFLLLSASPSLRGGAQGLIHLKVPLDALGAFVYPRLFTLSRATEAFDKKGALMDSMLYEELEGIIADFLLASEALKRA